MERTEQLLEIERRLVYKSPDLKRLPLVRPERYVVKSGQLTQFLEKKHRAKLSVLQTRHRMRQVYVFLFSDLLLVTEKKTNGAFVVKDYSYRRFVEAEPLEAHSHKIPISVVPSLPAKPHLFQLILMQNARGKQSEFLLNTESETDRERWLSALRPPVCSTDPNEKIYASWDCPQAVVRHNYEPSQEDELSLYEGDLVNILRKMPDGWFYGERVKDGKNGWFPSSYVQQILNDHVRANNYRQRLRVIQQAAAAAAATTYQSPVPPSSGGGNRLHDKRVSLATISAGSSPGVAFKDRLRRLSNPRAFFQ